MNKENLWRGIKKIFLGVFILHTAWFFFFIVQKFRIADFPVANLKTKVLLVCAVLLLLGVVYYKWLRHIAPIKKIGIILFSGIFNDNSFLLYV